MLFGSAVNSWEAVPASKMQLRLAMDLSGRFAVLV